MPNRLALQAMLRHFIGRVIGRVSLVKPEVMVCARRASPASSSPPCRTPPRPPAARSAAHIIPEPLAAAIGARIPVNVPQGHMIVDRGIVLTGGTSLLRNLDRLITQEIGISCYVADNHLECVAMGAGIALDHLDLIKRSMPAEGEWLVSF